MKMVILLLMMTVVYVCLFVSKNDHFLDFHQDKDWDVSKTLWQGNNVSKKMNTFLSRLVGAPCESRKISTFSNCASHKKMITFWPVCLFVTFYPSKLTFYGLLLSMMIIRRETLHCRPTWTTWVMGIEGAGKKRGFEVFSLSHVELWQNSELKNPKPEGIHTKANSWSVCSSLIWSFEGKLNEECQLMMRRKCWHYLK